MAGRRLTPDALDAPTAPVADVPPAIAAGSATVVSVVSENARLLASNIAINPASDLTIRPGDLVAGAPDPEFDLVPVNVRIPRYLAQAVDLAAKLTKRPRQAIVADALRADLDPRFVAECRRQLGA